MENKIEEFEYIIHKHYKECKLQFVNCKRIVLTEEEWNLIKVCVITFLDKNPAEDIDNLYQVITKLI